MKKRVLFPTLAALLLVTAAWATPHLLPQALAAYRPDIRFLVPAENKSLFITIDDAPSKNTAAILAVLKKHQVNATFFIIADRASSPLNSTRSPPRVTCLGTIFEPQNLVRDYR